MSKEVSNNSTPSVQSPSDNAVMEHMHKPIMANFASTFSQHKPRLKTLLMLSVKGELCVCDLTDALQLSQPKISRHLADLRKCGLVLDTRKGKWVYYKLHPELPSWALEVITNTASHNGEYINGPLANLTCADC